MVSVQVVMLFVALGVLRARDANVLSRCNGNGVSIIGGIFPEGRLAKVVSCPESASCPPASRIHSQ